MNDSEFQDLNAELRPESSGDDPLTLMRRRRRQFWVFLVGFIAIVVVPGYVLLTVAVFELHITPATVQATALKGTSEGMAVPLGDKIFLLANQTRVTVSAEGYEPYSAVVKKTDLKNIEIHLIPLPGQVKLIVEAPSAVTIHVDDRRLGVSNELTVELAAGTHKVQLSSPMIQTLTQEIKVDGYGKKQEFKFAPPSAQSYLTLKTDPEDAQVRLNGNAIENPLNGSKINIGAHELVVEAEGFATRTLKFTTKLDERKDLGTIKLAANPVEVRISTNPTDAALLLGGQFIGTTNKTINLEARKTHQLTIRKPSFSEVVFEIRGEPGEQLARSFNLDASTITLSIQSNLEGSVAVDGLVQGQTPIELNVTDKSRISVRRQGYVTETREMRVAQGLKQDWKVTLLTHEERKYKDAPGDLEVLDGLVIRKFPAVNYNITEIAEIWGDTEQRNRSQRSIRASLTRPFYISKTEVSVSQFNSFQGKPAATTGDGRLAVSNVSWTEAAQFCNWLSQRAKLTPVYQVAPGRGIVVDDSALGYRLPTELEWLAVYSVEIETGKSFQPFPWGQTAKIPRGYENFAGREAIRALTQINSEYIDNHAGIAPVGSYPANPNGIRDMAGNVSEWVHDYYDRWPAGDTLTDYSGPKIGSEHVVRGGSFQTIKSDELATSHRRFVLTKEPNVGFRIARWVY